MTNIKYLLVIAIMACFACSVFAIKCYHCESHSNPKCGEMFESEDGMKFDCARIAPPRYLQSLFSIRNATGCMKKTLDIGIGQSKILRTCYFGDVSNTHTGCQSDPSLPFEQQKSCEVCSDDLCNSSTSMAPIGLAILGFFALARLFS